LHQLRLVLRKAEFARKHLYRTSHRGQRVADFVCKSGGHFAERRQSFLSSNLALQFHYFRKILERQNITARVFGFIYKGSDREPKMDFRSLGGRAAYGE